MRRFSLDQLTVLGVRPAELVELATQAGYAAISLLRGIGDMSGLPALPLRAGHLNTRAMAQRLAAIGVVINNNADGFALFDATPMEEMPAGIALMAEMGARGVVTLIFDSDPARGLDRFCQLRKWAVEAGVALVLEFTPLSRITRLADALALHERAGGGGVEILVDLLHLNQSGGTPAQVAALPDGVVGGAQLCDGPARCLAEEYAHRAMADRMVPGKGELPVRAVLAALPADVVCRIEVPMAARAAASEDHLTRARLLLDAACGAAGTAGDMSWT